MMTFVLLCLAFFGLRCMTLGAIRWAVDSMYLTANSHSMYKKIMPELKGKSRFLWPTRLCFWNEKSQKEGTMHFLIVLNTVAVLSIVIVVIFIPVPFTDDYVLTGVRRVIYAVYCWFHFCCIVGVSVWISRFHNNRMKKKRSPRK